jgi:hypothetical protein
MGSMYNPMQVMMGSGRGPGPYISPSGPPAGTDPGRTPPPAPTSTTLAPEAVRATGSGPFDPTYRQNLATYAGGQFQRPSVTTQPERGAPQTMNVLSFNPTDISTFPGQPVGGGNAPLQGLPFGLLSLAQGGLPFSWGTPLGGVPNPLATIFGGGGGGSNWGDKGESGTPKGSLY